MDKKDLEKSNHTTAKNADKDKPQVGLIQEVAVGQFVSDKQHSDVPYGKK